MLNTEFTPLINKVKNNGKCKLIYFLILVLCVVGAMFCYHSLFPESSLSRSLHNLFVNENVSTRYPTKEEIDEYRSKIVVIEYSLDDVPESDYAGSHSDTIHAFHNNLIVKHGYNSHDYNIQFVVKDADHDDDSALQADVIPTLRCGSVTTESTGAGPLVINCVDALKPVYKVTGCVSYTQDGVHWGETGSVADGSDCMTQALAAGTRLTARCCKIRGVTLTTTYASWTTTDYCSAVDCAEGDTEMGCGVAYTDTMDTSTVFSNGAKRTQDDRTGLTGCKAQRGAVGPIQITPYCGSLSDGAIKCRTLYGSKATSETGLKYTSEAACQPDMTLTDCDNQIGSEINNCDATASSANIGVNYGGYMVGRRRSPRCAAFGSESIVAIATCCKIEV